MAVLKYLLGILVAVNAAYALKCYKCDSSEGIGQCNYGLASITFPTVDCDEGGNILNKLVPKSCVKVIGKSESGDEYVARGCMVGVGDNVCNAVVSTAGFFSTISSKERLDFSCSTCDTDQCNSAPKYTATSIVAVVIAAIAFLF